MFYCVISLLLAQIAADYVDIHNACTKSCNQNQGKNFNEWEKCLEDECFQVSNPERDFTQGCMFWAQQRCTTMKNNMVVCKTRELNLCKDREQDQCVSSKNCLQAKSIYYCYQDAFESCGRTDDFGGIKSKEGCKAYSEKACSPKNDAECESVNESWCENQVDDAPSDKLADWWLKGEWVLHNNDQQTTGEASGLQDPQPSSEAEKLAASEDEVDEAILNIEAGLLKIPADEKAAYDSCMKDKVLPGKTKETNTAHLLMLNGCYNTVGKEGWHCAGNRRECATGMCCGKVSSDTEVVRYSCQTDTATKLTEGDTDPIEYTFECNKKIEEGAAKVLTTVSVILAALAMLE